MILTVLMDVAVVAFLFGMAYRFLRIAAMPVHARWELYPVPAGLAGKIRMMLSEIIFLEGVRRHQRSLWVWSWLFHVSLYLLIAIGGLSLAASISLRVREAAASLISTASVVAFSFGIAGSGGLIVLRMASPRFRPLTALADLINLALLLALFLSGLLHVLIEPAAAIVMVEQAGSLLGLAPPPVLHPLAVLHLCLIALFIAYMPFTHMAHMVLKYFTFHSVRWDDRSVREDPQSAGRMAGYLAYPVSWSAPHIRGGETGASWANVVSGNFKERKVEKD